MSKIKLKKEPKYEKKHDAFVHQREAFFAIKDNEYSAIFHEQGLGKSKIAIDLSLYWLENKIVDTVLIVAKKSLLANWIKELNSHSYIYPKIISQNKNDNYYVFNSPSRLFLTNYEVLKSEQKRFELFLKSRDVAIILDESTKIKNPDSSLTKSYFELSKLFKKRVIMTGTPIANRPFDIWSQIYFLDHGESLGEDFKNFKRSNNLSNDLSTSKTNQNNFEKSINNIFANISGFTVRKTKDDNVIQLPDKVYQSVKCDWESNQYSLYRQVQKEMKTIVVKNGIPDIDNSEETLKRMLRLVQIASNPYMIDESYKSDPGKIISLSDLVTEIMHKGEKCIIWTSFIKSADWLNKYFKFYGSLKVHGKLSISQRNSNIDSFINNNESRILIATPGAAKEGLTLTIANHVIFYDRTFSLDDYLQAQDRIHRISQKKKCYVYNLIMNDSIDEWIDLLIESKSLAAKLAQGDISLDYYKSKISYDFGSIIRNILNI